MTDNRRLSNQSHARGDPPKVGCRTMMIARVDALRNELDMQSLPRPSFPWSDDLVDRIVDKGQQSACDIDSGKPHIFRRFDNTCFACDFE